LLKTFSIFLIFSSIILSQSSGQLRGIVTDSLSSESLLFANVLIKELNIGTSTDEHGYYFIPSLPANNNYSLVVSYVGYSTKTLSIVIVPNKITEVNIKLSPINVELQTIETIGQSIVEKNAPDIGLQKISIKELQSLPKGVETDVFRSLAYVPGINFTGDVSARYYVRGSDNNQNLILLNGTTIYNPFHALGLFSVIDPSMIKDIKLYKGGFPSEYGGRLSSVMDLITIDGNRNKYSAQSSISFLTGSAMVEGPIPNGSFVITGRRSYNPRILKNFLNDKTVPFDFYDASAKLNYSNSDFIEGAKFVIHSFFSKDKVNNENLLKEDFSWENNAFGLSWFQVYDNPMFSEYDISFSNFKGEVIPNFSNARAAKNELQDITFKSKYTYLYNNKDEILFGTQITSFRTSLLLENNEGLFSKLSENKTNFSVFLKYKFLQYENLGVEIGSRYNLAGISKNGSNYIEPRVSFTFKPFTGLSIKGAWGKYQQEITTISDENEVISLFDPFVIVPDYLKTPRATHYSLGMETNLFSNWKLSSEIYYKDLSNITALNPNKNFETDHDLISADGESYGLEFFSTFIFEPMQFTASYTLSYAYKEENKWLYYPKYDSRHYFNLMLETNLGKGWKTSVAWIYKTGLPFTQTVGFYEKLFLSDFRNDWDIYSNYFPFSILGDKNIGRLPNYHRMDITISKELQIGFANFSIDASIINLYDRKNIFYFDRATGEQVNMLPFLPTLSIKIKI
jgi:hypothetical protein